MSDQFNMDEPMPPPLAGDCYHPSEHRGGWIPVQPSPRFLPRWVCPICHPGDFEEAA